MLLSRACAHGNSSGFLGFDVQNCGFLASAVAGVAGVTVLAMGRAEDGRRTTEPLDVFVGLNLLYMSFDIMAHSIRNGEQPWVPVVKDPL